jgi:hypothetical protein
VCMVLCAEFSSDIDRQTDRRSMLIEFGGMNPGMSKADVCPELMGRRHKGPPYMQVLKKDRLSIRVYLIYRQTQLLYLVFYFIMATCFGALLGHHQAINKAPKHVAIIK